MAAGDQVPPKRSLLLTYLRLSVKQSWYRFFPSAGPVREKIAEFRVDCPNYRLLIFLFEEIFAGGEYYFKPESQSPLVFDLGANVGMALLFFKWLYPKARIVAFEASEQTFKFLKSNVDANQLSGVQIHNKAVSDFVGTLDFHYDSGADDLGQLSMSLMDRPGFKDSRPVEAVRVSDYIHEEVDFLKIDIEGAEGLVIRDLARSGKLRYIKEMTMEYHHHLSPEDDVLSELLGILEQNGFGYQIASLGHRRAFRKGEFQSLLVHAYRKSALGLDEQVAISQSSVPQGT